jgi:hypothetical protein
VLQKDESRLEHLERLDAATIRRLRERVTDELFDADARVMRRVAASSRHLPVGLVATLAQHAFGPLLAARIAALIEPDRAADIAARLPAGFNAEVAAELDPRRASELIARIPLPMTVQIAGDLARNGEHVAMGRLASALSDEALGTVLANLTDADILKIAFVSDDKHRLDDLAVLVGEDRLPGLTQAALDYDLWDEALLLLHHLGEERRAQLAAVAAELPGAFDALVAAAEREGVLDEVLPYVPKPSRSSA